MSLNTECFIMTCISLLYNYELALNSLLSHLHADFVSAVHSTASSPSSSLRSSLMVTTTWSAASTLLRRSWLPSTRPCLTTTSTWRAPCSNPTWWPQDTPALTSTATRRLQWQLLLPCAALCLLPSPVSWMHTMLICQHGHICTRCK